MGTGNLQIVYDERGYGAVPEKYVCKSCVQQENGDDVLAELVDSKAEEDHCDYCDETFDEPCTAPLEVIVERVVKAFRLHYDFANNKLPYESAEGSFQDVTYDTSDLLADYFDLDSDLGKDLRKTINDETWCKKDPFALSQSQMLMYSWEQFCKLVKHQKRFMFSTHSAAQAGIEAEFHLRPLDILEHIGQSVERLALHRTIGIEENLYRVRAGRGYDELQKLVSPPDEFATAPNRMNPPGISMLYAAFDEEVALHETLMPGPKHQPYVMAKLQLVQPVNVVDLTHLPPVPSIFDVDRYDDHFALRFLHAYVFEISREVDKGAGYAHIEYVPTQILTEFFRYGLSEVLIIQGFQFRSAKSPQGETRPSLVLFFNHDTAKTKLQLLEADQRTLPPQATEFTMAQMFLRFLRAVHNLLNGVQKAILHAERFLKKFAKSH